MARLGELTVFRDPAFLKTLSGIVETELRKENKWDRRAQQAWTVDNLHKHFTRIDADRRHVEADDLTYTANLIRYYELGKFLINSELEPLEAVQQLPSKWMEMGERFGLKFPEDNRYEMTILQDPHFAMGLFAYFPVYGLADAITAIGEEVIAASNPDAIHQARAGDMTTFNRERSKLLCALNSHQALPEGIAAVTGGEIDTPEALAQSLTDYFAQRFNLCGHHRIAQTGTAQKEIA